MKPWLLVIFIMLFPLSLKAEESSSSRDSDYFFTLDPTKVSASPTFSLAAPSGLTPFQKVAFVGIGGIKNLPGRPTSVDGAMSTGFGFAISEKDKIGVLIGLDLGSINPSDGGVLDRGDLGLAIGKYFDAYNVGISLGIKNISLWHADAGRNTPSVYLAATKITMLGEYRTIMNIGFGNNAFRTLYDTGTKSERSKRASVFGSVAVYPLPQLSLVADYTAGVASLGLGIVPVAAWPVSISLGLYDVTKEIKDHDNAIFIASLGYSYSF